MTVEFDCTPVRRKDLADSSYTSSVIANFFSGFVAMAMGVGRGRVCLKIVQYRNPENFLLSASISEISHTQAELLQILSQISLPWQQGSVVVELSNTFVIFTRNSIYG